MIVGEVEMGLKNGKTVKGDFVARMIVDAISLKRGHPRLELSQVWAVSDIPFLLCSDLGLQLLALRQYTNKCMFRTCLR